MADRLDYALLSDHVYARSRANIINLDGSGWVELTKWRKDDTKTGFSAAAYQKGNEIVIAFAGTDDTMDHFLANIPAALALHFPQPV